MGSRVRDLIADASMPIPLSDLTSFGGGTPRSADESSPGVKPSGTGVDGCQTGSLSQKQVEYFIATQVNLLVHNETKALPPKTLQVGSGWDRWSRKLLSPLLIRSVPWDVRLKLFLESMPLVKAYRRSLLGCPGGF